MRKDKNQNQDDMSYDERRAEREAEILDMGGDPFFLTDEQLFGDDATSDDDADADEDATSFPSMSLLAGMAAPGGVHSIINQEGQEDGGDAPAAKEVKKEFLWDGNEDDAAHFDD